jgi:hypothetical protein
MSNTRYIEVNSHYRDRVLWPDPSQFEMLISQTGRRGSLDAVDPVSTASAIRKWEGDSFNTGTGGPALNLTVPVSNGSGQQVIIASGTTGTDELQEQTNYYAAAVAYDNVSQYNRVTSYRYLGNNTGEFIFAYIWGTLPTSLTLTDPSDVGAVSIPTFFVPNGLGGENAYNNSVLFNETQQKSVDIVGYSSFTHLLTINGTITGWNKSNIYSIRKQVPSSGVLSITGAPSSNSIFTLPNPPPDTSTLDGDFLEVSSTVVATLVTSIRRISKYINISGTVTSSSSTTIVLDYKASDISGYYNGFAISTPALTPVWSIIQDYNVTNINGLITRTATLSAPYTGTTSSYTIDCGLVDKPFNFLLGGQFYCLLPFSYDSMNPFTYSGSTISQQEMVCYEIQLLSLILPNSIIDADLGSRIAFYPYVYVELSNVSAAGAGISNTIYSNNPNSRKMLFIAPVSDVQNPLITPFVKLTSNMVQTIKFKPNDNLRFSVYLPSGELYKTVALDNYSPVPPNTLVQVSAVFGIKRL